MDGRIDSVSRVLAASPHSLYQAFITPSSLVKWLPPEGMSGQIDDFQPEVGKGYRMTLTYEEPHSISGKTTADADTLETIFTELVPDKKIAGTSVFETEDPDVKGELLLTWYFEELEAGTRVILIVENVPVGIPKAAHIEGLNSTLDNLERFVQSPSEDSNSGN